MFDQEFIELTITVDARYQGTRIAGPCLVSKEVELKFPYQIDPKFINLAKVMEGLIPSVVEDHKNKVMADYTTKKDKGQLSIWGTNGRYKDVDVSVSYANLAKEVVAETAASVDPETGEITTDEAAIEDAPATLTITDTDGNETVVEAIIEEIEPEFAETEVA